VTRKILYSPGYGAGWTTWAGGSKEFKQWMLTYQPIIDFLEAGGTFEDNDGVFTDRPLHPILVQFKKEAREKFGEDPYVGGARDLEVIEVEGEVKIDEYDGFESVTTRYDNEGWL
jgi:hypothetical protein